MKRLLPALLCIALAGCAAKEAPVSDAPAPAPAAATDEKPVIAWRDAREFTVEGKPFADTEGPWERLPARAKGQVPDLVWNLSKNTAGICVRFVTDSKEIHAQWDGGDGMNHMAPTGVAGLDLYERTKDGGWKYVATGRPKKERTEARLVDGREGSTEYLLFLPLYHAVTDLKLGFVEGSGAVPAAPRPAGERPIVFYGTSITQGGCASRSGMSHPAILARWLDREVVNLGFSGSGRMEPIMAEFVGEIDASLFVLECLPNLTDEMIAERTVPFVKRLRELHPGTPILLVESCNEPTTSARNALLRAQYAELRKAGIRDLHYLPNKSLLATREEGTVDGIHPTDLGYQQIATAMEPTLRKILAKYE